MSELIQKFKLRVPTGQDTSAHLHADGARTARARLQRPEAVPLPSPATPVAQPVPSPWLPVPDVVPDSPGKADARQSTPRQDFVNGIGDAPWGATEGGRDKLGWVRQLVKYTETHPIYIPDNRSSAVEFTADHQFEKTVFPSLKPTRREDVILLEQWLVDMMGQLTAQLPDRSQASGDQAMVELADAALWLYGVAFEELRRHIAVECRDRAELLSCMWDHCFSLVELRCSLMYEGAVFKVRSEFGALRQQRWQLKQQVRALQDELAEAASGRQGDAARLERQTRVLAQKLADTQGVVHAQEGRIASLEEALQAETEGRLTAEAKLAASESALAELGRKAAELEATCSDQALQIAGQHKQLEDGAAALKDTTQQLERSRIEERSLLQRHSLLEANHAKLQREFDTDEILLVALKAQLAERDGQLAEMRQTLAELRDRNFSFESGLDGEARQRKQLEGDLQKLRHQKAQVETMFTREKADRAAELAQFQAALAASGAQKSELEEELGATRQQASAWKRQTRELQHTVEDLRASLHADAAMRQALQAQLEALQLSMRACAITMEELGLAADFKDSAEGQDGEAGARPSLAAAPPNKIAEFVQQQLRAIRESQRSLEAETAVAVERWSAEEMARRKLEERVLQVKTAHAKSVREGEALKTRLDELEEYKTVAAPQLEKLKADVASSQVAAREVAKELRAARAEAARLVPFEQKAKELAVVVVQHQEKVERLEEQVHVTELQVVELQQAEQSVAAEVADQSELIAALQAQVQALQAQLEAAAKELQGVKAAQQAEVAAKEAAIARAEARDGLLQDALRQLAVSKFLLADLNSDEGRDKAKAFEAEVFKLKTQLVGRARAITELQGEVEAQKAAVAAAEAALADKDVLIAEAQAATLAKQRDVNQLRMRVNDLTAELDGYKFRLEQSLQSQSSLAATVGRTATLGRALSRLPTLAPAAMAPEAEATMVPADELSEMAAQAGAAQVQVTFLEAQIAALHQQLEAGGAQHRETVAGLEERINGLTAKLSARAQDITRLEAELAVFRQQSPRPPREAYEQLAAELAERDAQLAAMRDDLDSAQDRFSELTSLTRQETVAAGLMRSVSVHVPAAAGSAEQGDGSNVQDTLLADSLQMMHQQETIWMRAKIGILTFFCSHLRANLGVQTKAREAAQHQAQLSEVESLAELRARDRQLAASLADMHRERCQVVRDAQQFVRGLRGPLVEMRAEVLQLRANEALVFQQLQGWTSRFQNRRDQSVQANDAEMAVWLAFAARLPRGRPRWPMTRPEVVEVLVATYRARLDKYADTQGQVPPSDTVFEALLESATGSQLRPSEAQLMAEDGPLARLLTSSRTFQNDPKVLTFCRFVGLVAPALPPHTWQLYLRLLDCLRRLLSGAWPTILQEWARPEGTAIPIQCIMDILGNVYNVDNPAALPVIAQRILPLVTVSRRGPSLDLDSFLLVLLEESSKGSCPVDPLSQPRRLTDGSLGNMLNVAGNAASRTGTPPGSTGRPSTPLTGTGGGPASPLRRSPAGLTVDVEMTTLPPLPRSPDLLQTLQTMVANTPTRGNTPPKTPLQRRKAGLTSVSFKDGTSLASPRTPSSPRPFPLPPC
ncbi:hypothetical protein WJX72_008766 [[Myrmecia] bisecta]|uniref:Uncharacterized protein n=1 Tax=[Myrmecia] bisecta TaxID=41462 RepID=A0AAW1PSV6_9CHLO